jgi:WD40 repeat protein
MRSKTGLAVGLLVALLLLPLVVMYGVDATEYWRKMRTPPPVTVYTAPSLPPRAASIRHMAALDLKGIWYSRGYRDRENEGDYVGEIAVSRDGKLALVSGTDTLRLWDVERQRLLHTLSVHFENWHYRFLVQNTVGGVVHPTLSPDSRLAASDFNRTEFKVWDVKTGRETLHVEGHRSNVHHLLFSKDGDKLYTASFDKTVKVWDTATGRRLQTFDGFPDWVDRIALSPNEDLLFASMQAGSEIRRIDTGVRVERLGKMEDIAPARDISPDWRLIRAGDEAPQIWDVASGRMLYPCPPKAALNPDWTIAAVADPKSRSVVRLLDLASQKLIAEIDLKGFLTGWKAVTSLTFAPDGRSLFVGTIEGEVLLFSFQRPP